MAQRRQIHDRYFKQAKEEGYAARSAYKLKEIDQKKQVIRRGDRVLDLGCAPGSWLQVASELAGPKGRIVGIDLNPVAITLPPNVRAIEGDATVIEPRELMALAASDEADLHPFDSVISDMAPNTEGGGGGTTDHFRSVNLCRRVLEIAPTVLKPGGSLVMKVFEGEEYGALLQETRALFADVKGFKPQASRDVSREMFVVAKGFKGREDARTRAQTTREEHGSAPKKKPGWDTPRADGHGGAAG